MTPEQRERLIEILRSEQEVDPEWQRILFPPGKREYELVYGGKEREEEILAETMGVPLQAVRAFGKNGNGWQNQLIFGDNLQVMKTLLEMKKKGELASADGTPGIRLVYIDPPFATKKEFKGNQEQKAYQDKIAGAEFLEFIRKRLVFIRELLARDGSLFFHTDHRKGHYIKVLLDEIFGEQNFRNEIALPGRASKNLQQQFKNVSRLNVRHDVIYWYSASPSTRFAPLWVEKHKAGNPEGHWHHFWSTADRKTMRYKFLGHKPTKGQWVWKKSRAVTAYENYNRFLKEAGGRTLAEYWRDTGAALEFIRKNPEDGTPQYWRAPAEMRIADTMWSGIPVYSNSTGYPTEKNEALLKQVLELSSKEGDIAFDAFAGSGTTLAVAEQMGRRWIGIDCGKLSIYKIQKRLLGFEKSKPFILSNAGLYDYTRLRELPWEDWRFFALNLFQCKDHKHRVGGFDLDGYFKGGEVLVYNHFANSDAKITYQTIDDIHSQIGKKLGRKFFIIAPSLSFGFQRDYVDRDTTRYYALRIPYSIIAEIHRRDFTAIRQPADEAEVNDTIEAVGFDFIRTPTAKVSYQVVHPKGTLFDVLRIKVHSFQSEVVSKSAIEYQDRETLSLLLVDLDYDDDVFKISHHAYADAMKDEGFAVDLPVQEVGNQIMCVLVDIYGNEYREVKTREELGLEEAKTLKTQLR